MLARTIWLPLLFAVSLAAMSYAMRLPLWAVVTLQFCFFLTVGRTNPNVAALALAPHAREAGTASALMGALQAGLAMAAGVAVATFSDGTVGRLAMLMTACAALSALSYVAAAGRLRSSLPAAPRA